MTVLFFILQFIVNSLLSATFLYGAAKITKINAKFIGMLAISVICSLLGFIPEIGPIVSLVAFFVLLGKWTDASFWPDAVWMAVVAQLLALGSTFLLGFLLAGLAQATA